MGVDAQGLMDAIENAGHEAQPYSGRGMFGKQCVGVVLTEHDLWNLAQSFGAAGVEVGPPTTDSMGLAMIAYWPRAEWPA